MRKLIDSLILTAGLTCALFFTAIVVTLFAAALSGCGSEGPAGPPGAPGQSITGPAGADGVDGADGAPGADGSDATIEVMIPCPNIPGAHPEVLWRVDGVAYAVYVNGFRIHLTALVPGVTYETTDNRSCQFSVDSSGNLVP